MEEKDNNIDELVDMEEVEDEEQIVVMTDAEGHEMYYREEMIIPVGNKNFALLVSMDACGCGCEHDHDEEEEPDVFLARIDFDEAGEPVYLDPTDEEFEAAKEAYSKMMDEE